MWTNRSWRIPEEQEESARDDGEDEERVGPYVVAHGGEAHAHEEVPAPVGQGAPRHGRRPRTHLEHFWNRQSVDRSFVI